MRQYQLKIIIILGESKSTREMVIHMKKNDSVVVKGLPRKSGI